MISEGTEEELVFITENINMCRMKLHTQKLTMVVLAEHELREKTDLATDV